MKKLLQALGRKSKSEAHTDPRFTLSKGSTTNNQDHYNTANNRDNNNSATLPNAHTPTSNSKNTHSTKQNAATIPKPTRVITVLDLAKHLPLDVQQPQERQYQSPLLSLSNEMLHEVLRWLGAASLAQLSLCCRQLFFLCNTPHMWKEQLSTLMNTGPS
jgi:hypothetical protein